MELQYERWWLFTSLSFCSLVDYKQPRLTESLTRLTQSLPSMNHKQNRSGVLIIFSVVRLLWKHKNIWVKHLQRTCKESSYVINNHVYLFTFLSLSKVFTFLWTFFADEICLRRNFLWKNDLNELIREGKGSCCHFANFRYKIIY